MKNASTIISAIALIGVLILFGLHFSGNKSGMSSSGSSSSRPVMGNGHIAFVDVDSLEAHYEYLKNKKVEFEKRQEGMKGELQQSEQQMQIDIQNYQRKAQAGTLTEAEAQSAQKRIGQMQQSLKTREEVLTQQLLKEQQEFNDDLKKRLDSFLDSYNKDKKYDYILSYTHSGPALIMYANKDLDITQDIIKGMNEMSQKMGGAAKENK
jgi:outer membrane protein